MAPRCIALIAVLALAGCELGGGTPQREAAPTSETMPIEPEPTVTQGPPTRTELVVQAIRECEIKSILIARDDTMWITYRGGRTGSHEKGQPRGLFSGLRSVPKPATS